MATIKDIAQRAGVSASTVSNVLNHRGNVSYEKIRAVEEAANAIGYRLNEAAALLRSGHTRTIAVVVPSAAFHAYAELYDGIRSEAFQQDFSTAFFVTDNNPQQEKAIIDLVLSSRAECCVAVSSLLRPMDYYQRLEKAGTRVVLCDRKDQDDADYIGFDMRKAAADIAREVCRSGARAVSVLTDMLVYPNEEAFLTAFTRALAEDGADRPITHIQTIASHYQKRALELVTEPPPDAVVCTNQEMAAVVLSAFRFVMPERVPRIYCLSHRRSLPAGLFIPYRLNYRQLGQRIAQTLLSHQAISRTLLPADGFSCPPPQAHVRAQTELTMLAPASPFVRSLEHLLPLLRRQLGIDLKITQMTPEDLRASLEMMNESGAYDLLRMDMAQVHDVGQRTLLPLSELDVDVSEIQSRMLPSLFSNYMTADGVLCALPMDPSAMLLFFRQDLLEDVGVQRKYFEETHNRLIVPDSYEALAGVSRFFDRRFNPESKTPYGLALADIAGEYVAHLAASMAVEGATELTVEVLSRTIREHQAMLSSATVMHRGWWGSLVDEFQERNCAFIMTYSNHAERICLNPLSRVSGRVGYAMMPGGRPMIGGGCMGISSHCREKSAVADLTSWLYSPTISRLLAQGCGASAMESAYGDEELLAIYPWLGVVRESLMCGVRHGILGRSAKPGNTVAAEQQIGALIIGALKGNMSPEQLERVIRKRESCG